MEANRFHSSPLHCVTEWVVSKVALVFQHFLFGQPVVAVLAELPGLLVQLGDWYIEKHSMVADLLYFSAGAKFVPKVIKKARFEVVKCHWIRCEVVGINYFKILELKFWFNWSQAYSVNTLGVILTHFTNDMVGICQNLLYLVELEPFYCRFGYCKIGFNDFRIK